jgi:hypothetical protein
VLAMLAAAALAISGCDTPAPSTAPPTPTEAPLATPVTTTYQLNQDVWYAGLLLHMDVATANLAPGGGTVDVAFHIENPTTDSADLNAKMTLVVAGNRVVPTRDSNVPSTPAGQTEPALLTFELQGIPSAADGVLEIGADPDFIAKVPFSKAAGDPVSFKPIEKAVKGTGSAGTLQITLRDALLRWDLPDWNQELTSDRRALTITYDVTFNGDFTGGFAFTGDNVALRLPSGKIVEARADGHSQSIDLIGAHATSKALSSRFEVPVGAKGKFALLIRNGQSQGSITFTIGG